MMLRTSLEEAVGPGLVRFRACPLHLLRLRYSVKKSREIRELVQESIMDTTTLLLIVIALLVLFGGGYYGRRRWF
jgi:uncharacterized membrane protein